MAGAVSHAQFQSSGLCCERFEPSPKRLRSLVNTLGADVSLAKESIKSRGLRHGVGAE